MRLLNSTPRAALAAAFVSFPAMVFAVTPDPGATQVAPQPVPQQTIAQCTQMEQNLKIPAAECGTKTPAELAEMMADRY